MFSVQKFGLLTELFFSVMRFQADIHTVVVYVIYIVYSVCC